LTVSASIRTPEPALQTAASALYPETSAEHFSARNFERLSALIQQYSGIKMPSGKRTMITVRLRARLTQLRLPHLDAYCDFLFLEGGLESEIVHLIDAVSTNKTDFFREPAHFNFLRETALPHYAAEGRRQLKFWSSAASIGAEAYTLAMVLDDFRTRHRGPDYSILGTDISTEALAVAVSGQFPRAMMEPVPDEFLARYILQPRDPEMDFVRVAPGLRAKMAWGRLNLMDERYPVERDMDVIFCRNVLIYFDRPTQHKVLERLCGHLTVGGFLILGHSESSIGANLPVTAVYNTIFRKV
jgi:chemotaxis protein methyltransferase CheR